MKHHTNYLLAVLTIFYTPGSSQEKINPEYAICLQTAKSSERKLNFFIISKRKKGKLDLATRFNVMRTKIKSTLKPKRFVAIVAPNTEKASTRILYRLRKYNATIGTIWFDSHGMYKKGYSLFFIGHDEINYQSIYDSSVTAALAKLAVYTTGETDVVIGSCYAGATYERASIDYKDTTRMNGDSLMIALGNIFQRANVYASESWVMTKPGLFNDNKIAVTGFPKRKLFRDVCYRPAWENVGKWNMYSPVENRFTSVNPVTLNSKGKLHISRQSYSDKTENKKDVAKNLKRLAPDLYK